MVKKWIPLESNPSVFNDFASKLGIDVSQYSFCDVFGLDEDLLSMVPQPVIAVLMCFPITEDTETAAKEEDEAAAKRGGEPPQVYYMKQTIGNACGTIALLHAVANNQPALQLAQPSFLHQFLGATQSLDPVSRGKYLEEPPEGAPSIEEAHQTAAAEGDSAPPADEEEVDLHFVAFVECQGRLIQLDGRRAGPVDHGTTSPATLLQDTARVVQTSFMDKVDSLSFNLMALAATADE
mmetsp:Transcript_25498/g.55461  ORF Transcript_25498/g.55461 Transcript_25498/m.55461 type:complete len:237 (-) Transcript_25498:928-1638(-)|eukprot:CAMPEP_0202899080 /NCGR_PEP_ID=MMETSP1392-20130828/7413_1 /ASSEMBLY_ACC=CAM_ASM_000868 /TAXON_ID=225041 /ORGANISM="Chlamydomonas chlamydogama, Strain SAG 11-48b" /LENGTH=236 /DNA_ID=CAMNT_0049585173 /DNA_START=150 /DNA_END=860 /DNA_ORIENTATION=+